MIIRVFRGRVRNGSETEFYRIVREERLPAFREGHAMVEAHVGRRHDPAGDLFMIVTIWPDYDSMVAWVGTPVDRPYRVHELDDLIEEWQVEHFEEITEADGGRAVTREAG